MIKWENCSKIDAEMIDLIYKRCVRETGTRFDRNVEMDLTAAHIIHPLDLVGLLGARKGDLFHDVAGIGRHLDRDTGALGQGFCPRCSARPGRTQVAVGNVYLSAKFEEEEEEYVVRWVEGGVYNADKSYFAGHEDGARKDALSTMEDMAKRAAIAQEAPSAKIFD